MTAFVAALPMYDWPEIRAETDALWAGLRDRLRAAGIEAPETLARRNADLPAVPGGIRDAAGVVIAPDPATLPPDELDFAALWRHPRLLVSQTCWGPMETGLAPFVEVVGQPSYDGIEGGEGPHYSSAIVMRRGVDPGLEGRRSFAPPSVLPDISPTRGEISLHAGLRHSATAQDEHRQGSQPISPLVGEMSGRTEGGAVEHGLSSPADGRAVLPLERLRGARFVYNNPDSMSGLIGITRDLEAAGEGFDIFAERVETGAHRASLRAVAEGRADVATIDCRSWALAGRYDADAVAALSVVGWTARRKGLPYITARATPPATVAVLRGIFRAS